MKLLIVDDELAIREGLSNSIDWKKIGVDEVSVASDGFDAMTKYTSLFHEIVITDIRMPGMDGIALCENIQKYERKTYFIILSGYSEFEYAKSAMKLGILNYELKPVDIEELSRLVATACKQIRDDIAATELEKLHQNLYVQDLLRSTLEEGVDRSAELKTHIPRIFDPNARLIGVAIGIDWSDGDLHTMQLECTDLFHKSIYACIQENMHVDEILIYRKSDRCHFVAFDSKSGFVDAHLIDALNRLKESLKETSYTFQRAVTLGISDLNGPGSLQKAYEQANAALTHQFYLGTDIVIYFKDIPTEEQAVLGYDIDEVELKGYIQRFDYPSAEILISEEFKRIKAGKCTDSDKVRTVCIQLKNILVQSLVSMGIDAQGLLDDNYRTSESVPRFTTIDDYHKWILAQFACVMRGLSDFSRTRGNHHMRVALEFIMRHCQENITVTDVANHIHVTPNYFCHMFKNEFNVSYSTYVNRIRVNKAKNMMLNSDLLIYQIAEICGFQTYDNFKKVFKKLEGHSPYRFRKAGPEL